MLKLRTIYPYGLNTDLNNKSNTTHTTITELFHPLTRNSMQPQHRGTAQLKHPYETDFEPHHFFQLLIETKTSHQQLWRNSCRKAAKADISILLTKCELREHEMKNQIRKFANYHQQYYMKYLIKPHQLISDLTN